MSTFLHLAVGEQNPRIGLDFILSLLHNFQKALVLFGFGKMLVIVDVHDGRERILLVVGHYLLMVVNLVVALR